MLRAGLRRAGLAAFLAACGGRESPMLYPELSPDHDGHCAATHPAAIPELRIVDRGEAPRSSVKHLPQRRRSRVRIRIAAPDAIRSELVLSFDAPRSTRTQACYRFEVIHHDLFPGASFEDGGLAITTNGTGKVTTCCATHSKSDFALRSLVEHQLGSVAFAYPPEPVGPGAMWTTNRTPGLADMIGSSRATYRLLAVDAHGADVAISVERRDIRLGESSRQPDTIVEGSGRFRFEHGAPVPIGTMRWRHRSDAPGAPWVETEATFEMIAE